MQGEPGNKDVGPELNGGQDISKDLAISKGQWVGYTHAWEGYTSTRG